MSFLYTIVIHKGFNLPKADKMGKIDAYCKVVFDDKLIGQTKVVKSSMSALVVSFSHI